MARKIILDCDPGHDDAVAILLALASPDEIDLLAITTVAGNVGLDLTERNARAVVELAGHATPVYAGCPRPILVPSRDATHVHGANGLNGVDLPIPQRALEAQHAVDFLRQTLREAAQPITICATGPLTNLAASLIQEPTIANGIDSVVLMGGAIGLGNITPAAEFNMAADPHAAAIVFKSGLPIVMAPLDLTHQALVTPARLAAIRETGRVGATVAAMLANYPARNRFFDGGPLHDPCALAYLIWPELMSGRRCAVAIETDEGLSRGRTLVDWWGGDGPANALVLDQIDAERFFTRLTERLACLEP